MVIDVDDVIGGCGAVIAAGQIKERRARARGEPGIEGIDENAIRIVRIDRNALIVPVLVIIAHVRSW